MSETQDKFSKEVYQGSKSTLCSGCGHDSVTHYITSALHLSQVPPEKLIKVSGIGCSSKTITYFSQSSHGINYIHGRMAPLATGIHLARHDAKIIGISGDGDSSNIGLGGFLHLLRRNVNMVYIVENNGVYGLTKGQFSATSGKSDKTKKGESNPHSGFDLCSLALQSGATFVARSFSGDRAEMLALLRSAFEHKGVAFIDVISPCITFHNHEGSQKSYHHVKEYKSPLHEMDFVSENTSVELKDSDKQVTRVHFGDNFLDLKKVKNHDMFDKKKALQVLNENSLSSSKEILTGLFYLDQKKESFRETFQISQTCLSDMKEQELKPSKEALKAMNQSLR